jgi:hypothetical protein
MFVCIKEDETDCVGLVVLEVKKNETVRIDMERMHRRRWRICEV